MFKSFLSNSEIEPEFVYLRGVLGPDICGYITKKVHVILNYKSKNHLIKKEITCKVSN